MASDENRVTLTDDVIDQLAHLISVGNMESIAYSYFKLDYKDVWPIRRDNSDSAIKINREIIRTWKNKSAEQNKVEVCFQLVS